VRGWRGNLYKQYIYLFFMKFQFGELSKLHGRKLRREIIRYSFVPSNELGLREHVLVYDGKIPSSQEEPDLYKGASISNMEDNSVELQYAGLEEIVELIGLKEDDEFREKHPDLIAKNELFRVDK